MTVNSTENKTNKSGEEKILHVINIFFSLSYLGNQYKYFSQKGYKQHLICSPSPELSGYATNQCIEYKEIKIVRKIAPLTDFLALIKISKYILKNKINLVIGHTPKGALLAMISSFLTRVPKRIYFRHGLWYETLHGLPRILVKNIDRFTALLATQVVCVSPSLAKRSLEDSLNSADKQIVLGSGTCGGIDARGKFNPEMINKQEASFLRTSLNIDVDAFVIGYCGRLVKNKGVADLVRGFAIVKTKLPEKKLKLLFIGDFEGRDSLPSEIIGEIKSNPDIIYTGFIFDSIENYYYLVNVFVLPSYREGFGMVTLEAASMKLPVLTTRVTGCIDAIQEGITGFYVSNNPDDIALKLVNLISNPKIKQYGTNGRERVLKHFDNSVIWPIIEKELYN